MGRVVRPHGLRGEVVVDLLSNRDERHRAGARFLTAAGPLEVTAARPFQHRWLMVFAGVESREAAEALRGAELRAEPLHDDDALWVDELVGSEVVLASDGAVVGTVVAVVANPAADLLELDGGRLVPATFVVGHGSGRVVVDPPAGLLD
ncbi:MAG TPA: hypothetical protein VE991_08195 [Acidimicrobiales bacterium]|nr:hypothetical protein [Acidimicrobiales bacterium]